MSHAAPVSAATRTAEGSSALASKILSPHPISGRPILPPLQAMMPNIAPSSAPQMRGIELHAVADSFVSWSEMAHQFRSSPQRTFKPERHRIKDELARVQQILRPRNLTISSEYIPPIKNIRVHGLWDGFVGHPVDVKICLMIAAQPNNRHTVIDTSDPLIETAEIDSITLAPSASWHDEASGPRPGEHVSLGERINRKNHETPGQRGLLLRRPIENPSKSQDHSLPPPKNRSVRVGKKSVYGTEDSHGNILGIATEYCLSDLAATQDDNRYLNQRPNTNEWGGATLAASQAQEFSHPDRTANSKHWEDLLLVPRKRVSPGKKSRGSLLEWQNGDHQAENVTHSPVTDLDIAEHNKELAHSELGSDLSNDTILRKSTAVDGDGELRQQDDCVSTPAPEVDIALSQGGPPAPFNCLHEKPWEKAASPEIIATRKSWQSPCQEDSSLKSRSRKRVRRSLDASFTGPHRISAGKYTSRAPNMQQKDRKTRSRSLSQSTDHYGKESEARTSENSSEAKHTAFMLGRASGQKIKRNLAEVLSRSCRDSRHSIIQTTAGTPMISEDSIHAKGCPSPASELRPMPRSCNLHSTTGQDRVFRSGETPESTQAEAINSLDDSGGSSYSLDLDQNETPTRMIPQKNRVPTSPDISDRPWIRREIPSSKYFPEDDSSLGRGSPMRLPFWIKYLGKLIICFPTNVDPGSYEVEVAARIWLTKADTSDWLIFKIPGLPYLDKPAAPGHLSFSLTTDLRYQIDRSLLEESYTCGPLAMGSSRFGPLPLLRLHSEVLWSENKRKELYFSSGDMLMSSRNRRVLESLSLEDGNPHNAIVLWLLAEIKKAMFDGPSEDPFAIWFARLDFAQLRTAMTDILYEKKKSPPISQKDASPSPQITGSADLSNKVNPRDHTTQNDDPSMWADDKIRPLPAYFAGLFTVGDPLKSEDLSTMAWNFDIAVTRGINGKLQCRLILEFSNRIPPLLTVDGRDWLPNFAIINGRVATHMEWRETEDGDLALQHVNGLAAADTIKIELHFQEHTFAEAQSSHGSESRKDFRLPNVVDKITLGGTLTCDLDNTIITLAEPNGEDVFWRTNLLDGRMSTALPKLHIGYKMYMAVENGREKIGDDLESLPDMQTILDLASPTPQPKHTNISDVINHERPPIRPQPSLMSSSQDRFASSLAIKDTEQGEPTTAAMAIQSAETDIIECNANRIADPVRQGTARFSFRRLILYLVLGFLMIEFHLRLRDETLFGYDVFGYWLDGLNPAEEWHKAIGIEDETDSAIIEAMHGSQPDGDIPVPEAEGAPGSDRGGRSWRDIIDHALGWQELEG
ncbi:MAG: hypothetical protein Q9195_003829 [Heterodermia aff. obscurata]